MMEKGAGNRFHANTHTMKLLKYVILQYWKRLPQAPQHRIFCCSKTVYCIAFRMKAQARKDIQEVSRGSSVVFYVTTSMLPLVCRCRVKVGRLMLTFLFYLVVL